MAPQLVLVTGASGFLGSEVVLEFLNAGFRVRGTVRSEEKAKKWEEKHGKFDGRLEWAIVKDVAADGAFDEAIKGVDLLAHTASPFHYDVKDNEKDMLIPALQGTRQALRAAQGEPTVKRVVVTSSFAAVIDMKNGLTPETKYDHTVWNPATYDEAKNTPIGEEGAPFVYCASKKVAEEEAWKISKEDKTKWKLTTILPPMITGPPQQVVESLKSLNTSSGAVWDVVDKKEVPPTAFPVWTDVRDIAKLHVRAVTEDVAAGKRYLCIAGHYQNEMIAALGRKEFSDKASRFPEVKPESVTDAADKHFKTDSSLVEKELLSEGWISFDKSIQDTLSAIFKLEEQLK